MIYPGAEKVSPIIHNINRMQLKDNSYYVTYYITIQKQQHKLQQTK